MSLLEVGWLKMYLYMSNTEFGGTVLESQPSYITGSNVCLACYRIDCCMKRHRKIGRLYPDSWYIRGCHDWKLKG